MITFGSNNHLCSALIRTNVNTLRSIDILARHIAQMILKFRKLSECFSQVCTRRFLFYFVFVYSLIICFIQLGICQLSIARWILDRISL